MLVHLTDRSLIRLSGIDTRTLLQGLITNNVRLLETQPALFSALLSPQGKFLHDFFLVRDGENVILETETRQMEGVLKLLTMYRLRAKVTFTPLPEWQVYAECRPETEPEDPVCEDAIRRFLQSNGLLIVNDPRHAEMGRRLYASSPLTEPTESAEMYETYRLKIGIPEGWKDAVPNRSLLLEMGYDKLHAVDFNKGCYVGQEVTARSRFRAELRKSIHRVKGTMPLPPFGTEILNHEGIAAGEIRSSCGTGGLCIIRHEFLHPDSAFTAAGSPVTLSPLPWMGSQSP